MSARESLSEQEMDGLRGLWLSRVMFNPFVRWEPETRTFEEYVGTVLAERGAVQEQCCTPDAPDEYCACCPEGGL